MKILDCTIEDLQQGKVSLEPEQPYVFDERKETHPDKQAGMDIMKAEYSRFSLWLADRDMIPTGTYAYKRVIDAIDHMDRLMLRGNVNGFLVAARHARYAFDEAHQNRMGL